MDLSFDDFKQWFHETYIKYKDEVVKIHCHDARVIEIDGDIAVYNTVKEDFSFVVPRAGYYDFNGYAIYLTRAPHRIWKRGLSAEGYDLVNPFSLWFRYSYKPDFDKNICQAILTNEQPRFHLDQVLSSLSLPRVYSISLSPEVMLSRSPSKKTNKYILWYKLTPVGTIDKQTNEVSIMEPIYKQEIEDTLRAIA